MNKLVAALSAASMLLPSVAALANPLANERATVTTSDLDLATVDGRERLELRLARAAGAVCGERMDRIHMGVAAQARECRTAVIREFQEQQRAQRAAVTTTG